MARSKSPPEPADEVYYGGAWDAGQSLILRQGFESMSRDSMQRIANTEWEHRRQLTSVSS